MFFRCCASLVMALVVSACASSAGTSLGEGGGPATTAARENSTLIVRAELDAFQGRSAWDAVYTLRRRWTQPGLGATFGGAPIYARVVVDGTHRGELRELRRISANDIESMRFLSAPDPDTTIKYGLGNEGGVIEVTTIRGRPSPKLSGDVIPAAAQGRLPCRGGSSSRRMLFAAGSGRAGCRGVLRRGGRWRVAIECRLAKPTRRRAGRERDEGRGPETPLAKRCGWAHRCPSRSRVGGGHRGLQIRSPVAVSFWPGALLRCRRSGGGPRWSPRGEKHRVVHQDRCLA